MFVFFVYNDTYHLTNNTKNMATKQEITDRIKLKLPKLYGGVSIFATRKKFIEATDPEPDVTAGLVETKNILSRLFQPTRALHLVKLDVNADLESLISDSSTVPTTGLTLNNEAAATINVGATSVRTGTVAPANATNKTITWVSSAPGVATVSSGSVQSGTAVTITGISAGTSTITATSGSFTKTFVITVQVPATGLTLDNEAAATINVGATSNRVGTIAPANATNKTINWTSSTPAVATVSSGTSVSGGSITITGVTAGTSTITATSVSGAFVKSFVITVVVPATGLTLNNENAESIVIGATSVRTGTITPANATNKTITWVSSTPAVATVSSGSVQSGTAVTITGVTAGTSTITATSVSGAFVKSFVITVTAT